MIFCTNEKHTLTVATHKRKLSTFVW